MKLKGKDIFILNKWLKYFKKCMDLMDLNDLYLNVYSVWGYILYIKLNCISINFLY